MTGTFYRSCEEKDPSLLNSLPGKGIASMPRPQRVFAKLAPRLKHVTMTYYNTNCKRKMHGVGNFFQGERLALAGASGFARLERPCVA
jgi:hypothetical protein